MFVQTDTILDKILARKIEEVAANKAVHLPADIRREAEGSAPPRDFAAALHKQTVALIAEIKKASPSKGVLIEQFDPVGLAEMYVDNGAAAVSVLTDAPFFQGSLDDLRAVRAAIELPVLRKEFILDSYQVYEARAAGADAVLLIAAALDDAQMAALHACIIGLGMAALVEVHDERELERVLALGARLIGVNNRSLKTFQEDLGITERLAQAMPEDVTLVAESAIRSLGDVQRMGTLGTHAILVGEGLVKAPNMAAQVRAFSSVSRVER